MALATNRRASPERVEALPEVLLRDVLNSRDGRALLDGLQEACWSEVQGLLTAAMVYKHVCEILPLLQAEVPKFEEAVSLAEARKTEANEQRLRDQEALEAVEAKLTAAHKARGPQRREIQYLSAEREVAKAHCRKSGSERLRRREELTAAEEALARVRSKVEALEAVAPPNPKCAGFLAASLTPAHKPVKSGGS